MAVEIKEFKNEDAQALSKLFKAADSVWPDGFAYNVEMPAEALLEEMAEERILNQYVAWIDGKIAGYANLMPVYSEEKTGYLGLLTGHPDYLGYGVGRDLIRKIIDKCVELGYVKLTLHTWPGNTRAVPLYKKTGFHWGTLTSELQNYVPRLLTHPLTKPYFERVDWYKQYKRALPMGYDTEKRNDALVFRYEWEAPEGRLSAVFDQRAKRLVELDTPELRLSLDIERFEARRGNDVEYVLRAENRGEEPLTVAANASGDGPLSAELLSILSVGARQTSELPIKATASKDETGFGTLKLKLSVNGHDLEMAASQKIAPEVESAMEPSTVMFQAGTKSTTTLNLRNCLDKRSKVELHFAGSHGLSVSPSTQTVELEPKAVQGIPLEVTSEEAGQYEITTSGTVTAEENTTDLPSVTAEAVATHPSDVVLMNGKNQVSFVYDRTIHEISTKGTGLRIKDRETGSVFAWCSVMPGPPYWPSKFGDQEAEVRTWREGGSAGARLTYKLKEPEGLVLELIIQSPSEGEVGLSMRLTNISREQQKTGLRSALSPGQSECASYVPLEEGVVRGMAGLPSAKSHGPGSKLPFAARWVAWELKDRTMGIFWPDTFEPHSGDWQRMALTVPEATLAPGQSWESDPLRLVVSQDGWRSIERRWQESQGTPRQDSPIIQAAGFRVTPSPVLLRGSIVKATLEARSYHPRPVRGEVRLSASGGLSVKPDSAEFGGLSNLSVQRKEIELTGGNPRECAEVLLDGETPFSVGTSRFPVITLGSTDGSVSTSQREDAGETLWTVDNGWISFTARPAAVGSLYSLSTPDGELLNSSFPEPSAMSWMYPFYGGITPLLWASPRGESGDEAGRLDGLDFSAETYERTGSQSVTWQGVRLSADLQHESLAGTRFSIEYLTVPQSNVLAIVTTISSAGPARRVDYSLETYPVIRPTHPLIVPPDQSEYAIGGDRGVMFTAGKRHVAAEYPEPGTNLLLVNASADGVGAYNMWPEGVALVSSTKRTVRPDSPLQTVHFLVAARDRKQTALYAHLHKLKDL